jgi:hypothetical protein
MFSLHTKFFIFGFLYYLILPLIVGQYNLFSDYPGMTRWHDDFLLLDQQKITAYLLTISTFFLSFFIFGFLSAFFNIKAKRPVSQNVTLYSELYWINCICFPLITFVLLILILNLNLLVQGYGVDHNKVSAVKGMLTTSTMILLYIALINYISGYKHYITKPVLFSVILLSFVLIFSGTRMYSLIVILAFLGNYISYKIVNKKFLFFISSGIFLSLLLVGLLRMGSDIKLDLLAYIFLAEPIFTWWSASTYLSGNEFNFLSMPVSFFSSIINFIPSLLLPDKATYMVNLSDLAIFEAPLGANSIFVGVQADFGYFFGLIYFCILGCTYSILSMLARYNCYVRAYYLCCCAVLPFQFFRDGFFIVNKQLLWNFLIIPVVIILMAKTMLIILENKRRLSI